MSEPLEHGPRRREISLASGARVPFEIDWDLLGGTFTEESLESAPIGELEAEIGAWAVDRPQLSIWRLKLADGPKPAKPDEAVLLAYDEQSRELRIVVRLDVEIGEDEALEASLPPLVDPIAKRWAARLTITYDPIKARWLTVQGTLEDLSRPASDMVRLGDEIRAALRTVQNGPLTLQTARDLVAGGHAGVLSGTCECIWLDAKGAPYRLEDPREAWELGKDVAAFANAAGGLILIPASTRLIRGIEMVDSVKTLAGGSVDEGRYRDVIASRVYPAPVGVEVAFVEARDSQGVFYVFVPPQREERKPFLVRGAPLAGRVTSQSITLPWRDGDRIRYDDIGTVHAALQQHRARSTADHATVERVWLESMHPLLRDAVRLARRAGLKVDVMHQGFSVQLPDGERVELSADHLTPSTETLAIHGVMVRLAPHGVPVMKTSGGFLVPDPCAE